MIERLAIDANAAIDLLRPERAAPPYLDEARLLLLPLPVLGELFVGALASQRPARHLSELDEASKTWTVIAPDDITARIYAELRVITGTIPTSAPPSSTISGSPRSASSTTSPSSPTTAASTPSPASPSSTGN